MSNDYSDDYSGAADIAGDYDSGIGFKDSESIKVHNERGVYSFSVRNGLTQSQAASNVYSGPFAVGKEISDADDEILMIHGYNAQQKRYFHNYIDIAQEILEVEEQEIELSSEGWVYLKINYDSNYQVEVKTGPDFPAQTDTELYIRIAYVIFADEEIKEIIQYQYGCISLSGRIF